MAWAVWEECLLWTWNKKSIFLSNVYLSILNKQTMQLGGSKILSGAKYVYLIAFFALLSGVFYPVITHSSWDNVIVGTFVLFVGLAGTVTVYKAGFAERHKKGYLIVGLALTSGALFLVYLAIGRI